MYKTDKVTVQCCACLSDLETFKHRQVEAVWKTKFDVLRKANTDAYGQFMSKIYKWLTWADLGGVRVFE